MHFIGRADPKSPVRVRITTRTLQNILRMALDCTRNNNQSENLGSKFFENFRAKALPLGF